MELVLWMTAPSALRVVTAREALKNLLFVQEVSFARQESVYPRLVHREALEIQQGCESYKIVKFALLDTFVMDMG